MARRSISRYGGTACNGQNGAKLADQTLTIHTQAGGFTSNLRRSLRLKEITAACETKSAIPAILCSKFQQEIGTDTRASSPNQAKEERPLNESSNGAPNQSSNAVGVMDIDDESNTSITLMDLLSLCKIKKRKASGIKDQVTPVIQGHSDGLMMPKEEELELEETIDSIKVKKAKSSPTSEKLNKHGKSPAPSSPAEKKTVLAFPLASAAPESELDETTLRETISVELPIENVDGKMKEFAEQNPFPAESPIAVVVKKEAIETCLVESDADNSMVTSSAVFVNKSDFDNKYLVEVLDKVSERDDSEHSDNVASNTVDPFLRHIVKQCKHDFSSSSTYRLENCQIASQDEHLAVGSTKCESAAPNLGLLSTLQHHINLPTELSQKEGQQKMQFEEIISFDRRDALLVSVENSTEFTKSDCEKSGSFSENDRRLVGNRKNGFSDSPFNKRIVSLVSQFKASNCLESHANFADGSHHGCTDENNCSDAICNHESLDIGNDRKCSMVNENCGGLVSQSMQPLLNCLIPQMDHRIPPVDKLVLVDAPYLMTEAISPYARPVHGEAEQAPYLTTTENLLEVVEWDPQIEKLTPSSQVLLLNRCSEGMPCNEVSDLTGSVNPSGQILCDRSVSQLHEIQAKKTVADPSARSSLESSAQMCEERQITMQSTKIQATDMKFGGNFCSEVEHSPKKLFSNRKEISPNSQEKLLRALNNGGLDDVVKLSYCMKKLCFDKGAANSPLSSVLDDRETFFETEQRIKKPKTMNQSLPEVTKGILKSPDTNCSNPFCLKNSSIHAQVHDAILFSQRQMQDTENIATKLLNGLNSLKSIVEETIFSEGLNSSSSKLNFDEIRLATKHASKLEVTTKKWLAMMAKDCTRFCKIMRLAENKLASPLNDLHKGRKKITFADEAGGALCQIKIYQQEPVAFIVPKS